MTLNIRQLLEQGHAALAKQHAEKEERVKGQFRVGSLGVVAEDGQIYGTCHRVALARRLGYDQPTDQSSQIMFAAGEANEDTWIKTLTAAGTDLVYLRHDEVPVKATIPGVDPEVLGHPDIVVQRSDGSQLGLELKGIYGYTTAISVYYENRPKTANLIQAAGYSYFRQIPYALCYTCPSWVKLNFYDQKRYGDKNILPFYRIFYMEWRDGVLWYRSETESEWVKTVITTKGIEDFFRLNMEMEASKDLGPRPTADYADGTKNKWDACGLCWAKDACDQYDANRDYDEWLDRISDLSQKEK